MTAYSVIVVQVMYNVMLLCDRIQCYTSAGDVYIYNIVFMHTAECTIL